MCGAQLCAVHAGVADLGGDHGWQHEHGTFYASADAFYNDGRTSGSLVGTPFVDPAVRNG